VSVPSPGYDMFTFCTTVFIVWTLSAIFYGVCHYRSPKTALQTSIHNNFLPINEVAPLLETAAASQHMAIKNLELSRQISTTIHTHFNN